MRRLVAPLVLLPLLVACVGTVDERPQSSPGASSPSPSPAGAEPPTRVELLGVAQGTSQLGRLDHAATGQAYRELWKAFGLPRDPVPVDLGRFVVLFLGRGEDACPDEIEDVVVAGDRVTLAWRAPPLGCEQPYVPTAFAVAVHRGVLPDRFVVELEGDDMEYGTVRHEVHLEPYDGPPPAPPPAPVPPPVPDEVQARLPLTGEAVTAEVLPDGARVWVTRSTRGVRVLAADQQVRGRGLRGARAPVSWVPGEGRLSGPDWYGLGGVSFAGRAAENLHWYESEVVDDEVHVGRPAGPVPEYPPLDPGPTTGDATQVLRHEDLVDIRRMTVTEALATVDDGVAVVTDDLVAWRREPLRLCDAPDGGELFTPGWGGCPGGSPTVLGVRAEETRPDWVQAWFGPHRVRIRDGAIVELVLGGGTASGVIEP